MRHCHCGNFMWLSTNIYEYYTLCSRFDPEDVSSVTFKREKSRLGKMKRRLNPAIPNTMEEFDEILRSPNVRATYQMNLHNGEHTDLYQGLIGQPPHRSLVFCHTGLITRLSSRNTIYVDGTFYSVLITCSDGYSLKRHYLIITHLLATKFYWNEIVLKSSFFRFSPLDKLQRIAVRNRTLNKVWDWYIGWPWSYLI